MVGFLVVLDEFQNNSIFGLLIPQAQSIWQIQNVDAVHLKYKLQLKWEITQFCYKFNHNVRIPFVN